MPVTPRNADYHQTLDYMYAQLPMFHRVGTAAYKKDLGNTLALCAHLGNPHRQFKTIHVGGTNGKGSVSHILAAICQAAGLKTGLYISPHYKDFRERIKVNGRYIPRRKVVDFVSQHREAIEQIQPSFFEMCVAMAFDHFAAEKVDIAIVEVGLGGRLDSTNVIQPLLSVITNISFDHMNLLGDTLPLIAGEKAGIIKPHTPVVIGETHPETAPVFQQKATDMQAPITFADQHYQAIDQQNLVLNASHYAILRDGKPWLDRLSLDAGGPFQSKNIATAICAVEALNALHHPELPVLDETIIRQACANLTALTRFQGRWQVIGQQPTILCDSAHNEGGLRMVLDRVLQLPYRQLHIVTGMVNDKDLSRALSLYPTAARYYFAKANIPRGLDAQALREQAQAYGLPGKAYSSVKNALRAARNAAAADDLILVIGSVFVVAEVI